MNEHLHPILTELKQRLTEHYGDRLERLVLFGSHARGDAEPDSDIDVLVVLKGDVRTGREIRETSEIRGDISLRNNTEVSCVFVSADNYQYDDEPLLINVRAEGMAI